MNPTKSNNTGETAELNANLRHWKELLRSLPEIRLEKIEHARQAVARNQYEDEGVIEVTLERLHSDMKNAI